MASPYQSGRRCGVSRKKMGGSRPSDLDLMANSVYRLELCSWDVRLGSDSGQSVAL
jgi:hypothetical protein